MLEEIDLLVNKYGIKEIIFLDDNLILDKDRFIRILHGLIERDYGITWKSTSTAVYALDEELLQLMKQSGCYQLSLAIESGSEKTLRAMKKNHSINSIKLFALSILQKNYNLK